MYFWNLHEKCRKNVKHMEWTTTLAKMSKFLICVRHLYSFFNNNNNLASIKSNIGISDKSWKSYHDLWSNIAISNPKQDHGWKMSVILWLIFLNFFDDVDVSYVGHHLKRHHHRLQPVYWVDCFCITVWGQLNFHQQTSESQIILNPMN